MPSPKIFFRLAAVFVTLTWLGCSYDYSALAGRAGPGGMPGGDAGASPQSGSGGQIASATGGRGVTGVGGTTSSEGHGTGGGGIGTGGSGAGDATGTSRGGSANGGETIGRGGGAGGNIAPGLGGQTPGAAGAGGSPLIVLSIDFIGGQTVGSDVVSSPVMSPSEVAGVKPASHWNGASGSMGALTNLIASNGTPTTAIVTWSSPPSSTSPGVWAHDYADAAGDVRMMNGYLDPVSAGLPATVVVAGLPALMTAAGYDVYVYVSGDIRSANTRSCRYGIGATSFTASEVGPTPTSFQGFSLASPGGVGNYVVFKSLAGASFTLIATPGTTMPMRAPVDGIQIVSPPGVMK